MTQTQFSTLCIEDHNILQWHMRVFLTSCMTLGPDKTACDVHTFCTKTCYLVTQQCNTRGCTWKLPMGVRCARGRRSGRGRNGCPTLLAATLPSHAATRPRPTLLRPSFQPPLAPLLPPARDSQKPSSPSTIEAEGNSFCHPMPWLPSLPLHSSRAPSRDILPKMVLRGWEAPRIDIPRNDQPQHVLLSSS